MRREEKNTCFFGGKYITSLWQSVSNLNDFQFLGIIFTKEMLGIINHTLSSRLSGRAHVPLQVFARTDFASSRSSVFAFIPLMSKFSFLKLNSFRVSVANKRLYKK